MVKTTTIRCKVKPEANAWLDQAAREVNAVWNYANETAHKALKPYYGKGQWLSGFDLNNLVAGCGDVFARIGIDVAQKVCAEFANKRSQHKKVKLKFRASGGSKKALGWIPFKAVNIRQKGNSLTFCSKRIRLFNPGYYTENRQACIKLREGDFSQDALGNWYLNQTMDVVFASLPPLRDHTDPHYAIGIDPGKDMSLSTGEKLIYGFYREGQEKIAQLQKRGHKKQAKREHARIRNKRLDQQHKDSTRLIREHGEIYIGDNSVARMKQKKGNIRMGKSISDNAIGQFKTFLSYKGHWAGRKVVLVSEHYTTQACCNCGQLTGPRGLKQLGVRKWQCPGCGTWHDRDENSACNMPRSPLSIKNAAFQPRGGLPFAGTR